MGIVLDSTVLIAAERERQSVSHLLEDLSAEHREVPFVISAITVMELEFGCHRANNQDVARKRRSFVDEVLAVIPVEPFTRDMGVLAAKVDAKMRETGKVIATADLLIGVTALYYSYAVGTRNARHFQMIPDLDVILI